MGMREDVVSCKTSGKGCEKQTRRECNLGCIKMEEKPPRMKGGGETDRQREKEEEVTKDLCV